MVREKKHDCQRERNLSDSTISIVAKLPKPVKTAVLLIAALRSHENVGCLFVRIWRLKNGNQNESWSKGISNDTNLEKLNEIKVDLKWMKRVSIEQNIRLPMTFTGKLIVFRFDVDRCPESEDKIKLFDASLLGH